MIVADPREVIIKFYYNYKTIEMTLQNFDAANLDNGVIRISIDIEDIKQINIDNNEKIQVIVNSPMGGTVDSVKLNAAKSISVFTLNGDVINKKTIMLAEISQYNIGDEIDESLSPEDTNTSDWKTN